MNKMTQNGKTYESNSTCQVCIGNKHYEGWKAYVIVLTPVVLFCGAIIGFGYFLFWLGGQ